LTANAIRSVRGLLPVSCCFLAAACAVSRAPFPFQPFLAGCDSRLDDATDRNAGARVYEVCPRKDHRGVNLISDALPFGRLWYSGPDAIANAIGYAKRRSPSNRALIRVYDQGGNGSAFTHVVLCWAAPPKEHMGKVSPTFIDITLCTCVWQ
jgi:hypothetical protein